jgi:metallophosphoesterase superfamily enzyme
MRTFSQAQALIAKSVLLDSRLALFHEEERWLAIADLHFGFELSQRMAGRLVPFWGMESIETRLRQLLQDYHPATLILLGDLVHDQTAAREFFSLVIRLREQCDVVLLAGNHDAQIKRQTSLRAVGSTSRSAKLKHFNVDLRDSFATDRFEFHHGDCARKQNGRIQIIGHFHPAATLHDGAGLRLKFPALVQESHCWILPAFSPWAAGTEWSEREPSHLWLCTPQRILLVDRE